MLRAAVVSTVLFVPLLLVAGCGSGGSVANTTPVTPTAPVLTVSPSTTLAFAAITVGATSAAQSFTITNTGNATLTLGNPTPSGNTTSFAQTATTCSSSLAQNASCTLSYTFSPQTTGALTETISITNNSATPTATLTLTGTGTTATVPTGTLTPAAITFPSTTAGSTATAMNATLTNNGNGALTISGVALSGAGAADFAIVAAGSGTTCTGTLGAGLSCVYAITFTPAASSTTYAATLTVTDNDSNLPGSTQSVSLSGAGSAPASTALAVLAPTKLTFPTTNVGTSATAQIVTLSNPGSATLTGIAISIGGGTASSAFTYTTTCGATLAASASCNISVTFTPASLGNYAATLSVADNATGSPQTVALSGTGAAAQAVLSSNTITFPATTINKTSGQYSVLLSNQGTATLTGIAISLGGANASYFAETTTCGTTLAAGASCTISATFSPIAAQTYSATISVASSATTMPQSIALSGAGTTSTINYQLIVFPETDNSATQLYNFINSAQKTIDMTMYEMQDTTFTADLVAACNRGVRVRVIFSSSVASSSATAYSALNNAGTNCSAVDSNSAFVNTHQKTITIDGALPSAQTAIMSLNLQTQYYSTTRDFAMIENDPVDIAAIEATFNMDYAAGGTNSATEFNYQPGAGDDLIWSPTTATAAMVGIINGATKTIILENEEMSASNIVSALESACQRGVVVHIAMVNSSSYTTNFNALKAAGCGLYLYANTSNGFYVHAKAVVADYGLSTQSVYMGSINYSTASLTENRELGMYITDPASVTTLYNTMTQDYTGNPVY